MDIADDKLYPEGPLVIVAHAINGKNNESRKANLQVMVDKTGPQIKIVKPVNKQRLDGNQEFQALVVDQVGVKKVGFFLAGKALQVKQDSNKPGLYVTVTSTVGAGGGNLEFKVVAIDNLDNISNLSQIHPNGCRTDADCKGGQRCCLGKSPTNQGETLTGKCFDTQNKEGELCDPCTQPCGKSSDGKLMGCLPQPCTDKPPYRCRPACNMGNPNRAADACKPANPALNRPAEYCAESDITKIDATLGSCAIGHSCDPLKQNTCAPGAKPPYNNCCPAGMSCFPADADANFCVPEGPKKEREQGCNNDICKATNTCGRGMVCVTPIGPNGRPNGPQRCNKMCKCNARCRAGAFTTSNCGAGAFCTPLVLSNGNVPLPVGACTR